MGNGQSCGHSNGRSVRHGHQTRTSRRSSISRANGQIGQSGGQSRGQSSTDRSSGQHQRTGKRSAVSRANGQIGQPDGQSRGQPSTNRANGRRLLPDRMGCRYVSFQDSSSNIQVSLRLQV